jgi:uncharacterized protein (DUF58 family)
METNPMTNSRTDPDDRSGVTASRDELIALGRSAGARGGSGGRRVATSLAGANASRSCGPGLEFAEVRAYQPGDDVRAIDWRVTARTGRVHSKLFEAERERPVWFVVDLGATMQFATRGVFKSVAAARVAALLAWRAHQDGERVGGIVVSPHVAVEFPLGRTRAHLLRFLDAIADATASAVEMRDTVRLESELRWLRERARTGSRVVVVSDFYGLGVTLSAQLASLARRCELTLVRIYDPLEATPPPPGRYRVSDGSGTATLVAKRSRSWREAYAAEFAERGRLLHELATSHRSALVSLRTDEPTTAILAAREPMRAAS